MYLLYEASASVGPGGRSVLRMRCKPIISIASMISCIPDMKSDLNKVYKTPTAGLTLCDSIPYNSAFNQVSPSTAGIIAVLLLSQRLFFDTTKSSHMLSFLPSHPGLLCTGNSWDIHRQFIFAHGHLVADHVSRYLPSVTQCYRTKQHAIHTYTDPMQMLSHHFGSNMVDM